MTNRFLSIKTGLVLGHVGLFLMLVIANLADRAYGVQLTRADKLSGFFARRGIDAVAAIGWLFDRLPETAVACGRHAHA
jgi:hypothetical protein